jgi:hypothetical protein
MSKQHGLAACFSHPLAAPTDFLRGALLPRGGFPPHRLRARRQRVPSSAGRGDVLEDVEHGSRRNRACFWVSLGGLAQDRVPWRWALLLHPRGQRPRRSKMRGRAGLELE